MNKCLQGHTASDSIHYICLMNFFDPGRLLCALRNLGSWRASLMNAKSSTLIKELLNNILQGCKDNPHFDLASG